MKGPYHTPEDELHSRLANAKEDVQRLERENAQLRAELEEVTKALENLYAVAHVERDEHYGAVARAAAALERKGAQGT